jgi:hypothetical protein
MSSWWAPILTTGWRESSGACKLHGALARSVQRCPHSNATRGNIDVTFSVDSSGEPQLAQR